MKPSERIEEIRMARLQECSTRGFSNPGVMAESQKQAEYYAIKTYLDEQYEKAQDSNKNIPKGYVIRCKSCGNFSGINYEPVDFWRCHCGWEYDKNNKVKEPVWPEKKRCRHPSLCGPNGDCDNCAHNKAIADCIKAWKDAQG